MGFISGKCGERRIAFARSVFVVFFISFLVFSGVVASAKGPPLPVVRVFAVFERDINKPEEYVGHVEAIKFVDLIARVEGFIERVNFKEGDLVKRGDLLYQIEKAPYEAKFQAAKAQVAIAKADLERARRWLRRLRSAKRESVRAYDMDKAITDELAAKARMEAALANFRLAKINLSYTEIRAPISGRIGKTNYTEGNLVNVSSGPLARIVQINPIRVVYSVSENNLAMIQTALMECKRGIKSPVLQPKLRLSDGSIYKRAGRIDFVDNEVDPETGTIAIRAVFDNEEGLLIPGQYVTVLMYKTEPKIMPVVPQSAVLVGRNGPYVMVVGKDDVVEARGIRLGPMVDTFWAVESGVRKGELVVVGGLQKLRPGMKVIVRKVKGM